MHTSENIYLCDSHQTILAKLAVSNVYKLISRIQLWKRPKCWIIILSHLLRKVSWRHTYICFQLLSTVWSVICLLETCKKQYNFWLYIKSRRIHQCHHWFHNTLQILIKSAIALELHCVFKDWTKRYVYLGKV